MNNDRQKFFDAITKGNRKLGAEIAKKHGNSNEEIKFLYEEIIKSSLYRVGELWEHNLLSVATEHLATSVSESIMNELFENVISETRIEKTVVLGCIEGEQHQVGLKMVADVFEMHGWDSILLGADVPIQDLHSFLEQTNPDLLAITLSIYWHLPKLQKLIKDLQQKLPNLQIVVGGQAFRHGGKSEIEPFKNVNFIENLEELENYIITKNQDHGKE